MRVQNVQASRVEGVLGASEAVPRWCEARPDARPHRPWRVGGGIHFPTFLPCTRADSTCWTRSVLFPVSSCPIVFNLQYYVNIPAHIPEMTIKNKCTCKRDDAHQSELQKHSTVLNSIYEEHLTREQERQLEWANLVGPGQLPIHLFYSLRF